MNLAINKISRTVAANGVTTLDMSGTFIQFSSSTGSFNFSIDGGPLIAGFTVLSITLPKLVNGGSPVPFRQIIIQDTSGAPNTVTVIVANGPVEYTPSVPNALVSNAPTAPKCTGLTALPDASVSSAYTGVSSTGKARRYFILSNMNTSGGALIYFSDGTNSGTPVQPQQSICIETAGPCYVANTSGSGASSYMVTEVFYT